MSRAQRTKTLLFDVREHLRNREHDYFTREELAKKFGARPSEVETVLMQLNREGLCSQADHRQCVGGGRAEMWTRDTYYVRRE